MSQHTIIRSLVLGVLGLAVGLTTLFVAPSTAFARAPLRLSFINTTGDVGVDSHEKIKTLLKKSKDIDLTAQDDVWSEADDLGLDEKDFRSGSLREKNAKNFQRIMKKLDVEGILILDIFNHGRTLQIVTIGPDGREVADEREDVHHGRISKSGAKSILKRSFRGLVPEVKKFRDDGGWDAVELEEPKEQADEDEGVSLIESESDDEEKKDEDEDVSIKKNAVHHAMGKTESLNPGFQLNAGVLVGKRTLTMTADNGFELKHDSPFAGFGGSVTGVFARFGKDKAVGAEVFGGYAPFTTIFTDPNDPTRELTFQSEYARIGGQLRYLQAFSPQLHIEVVGGVDAFSITIKQNPFYTGNRYLGGRAGVILGYRVGPILLDVGAVALPIFNINNSAGAYGEANFALGIEGDAGLSFALTDDIHASLGYTAHLISITYDHPKVVGNGDLSVNTGDVIHTGVIAIGYSL